MGKYMMRKPKSSAQLALMEVSQSSLGVRTRAKTLALQRLQNSSLGNPPPRASSCSYLQLRSRRLVKPPIETKRQRQNTVQNPKSTANAKGSSRSRVCSVTSESDELSSLGRASNNEEGLRAGEAGEMVGKEVEIQDGPKAADVEGVEASCGENVVDFEGRERSTRESTPCSLIRDTDAVRNLGSTTRPGSSADCSRRTENSALGHIPTAHEMNEFFAGAEEEQQRNFIEKYNFDPVNDKPLPGRYEWEKLDP